MTSLYLSKAEDLPPANRLPGQASKGDNSVRAGRFFLENRFLRIDAHPNGSLSVQDKERDLRYRGLHLFEDGGDVGELSHYCPPIHDRKIVSKSFPVRLSLIETEPAIRIRVRMNVPSGISQNRETRSKRKGLIKIWSTIRFEADSRVLAFETVIDNLADDHRLRVLFPTDCDPRACRIETHLAATERNTVSSDVGDLPPGMPPMTGSVIVQDQRRSISLLSEGLDEYELKLDNRRTLCLTLLRGIGNFSREDLKVRPSSHSVPSLEASNTQRRGRHLFRYGLCFHPESIQSH